MSDEAEPPAPPPTPPPPRTGGLFLGLGLVLGRFIDWLLIPREARR